MLEALKYLRSFTVRVLVAGFTLGLLAGVSNASAIFGDIRNTTFHEISGDLGCGGV